jgi:hypothetical protein
MFFSSARMILLECHESLAHNEMRIGMEIIVCPYTCLIFLSTDRLVTFDWLMRSMSNTPHDGVGHQWTESTSTGYNQWLSLAKIALKLPPVGRNRSLVANTIMWGGYKLRGLCTSRVDLFVSFIQLGPLHTWAKSRDLVMVRTFDSHPKVVPWVLGKPFYGVMGPQP